MKISLSIKNKVGFIDGSIAKPNRFDQIKLNAWIRNNNMVISWIINTMSKEISSGVIFIESALEMWQEVKECF